MQYVTAGSTVRLIGTFLDFEGALTDPTEATLTVYDSDRVPIGDPYDLVKLETGVWYYDFPTPDEDEEALYYYETSGVVNGKPLVDRESFSTKWILTLNDRM